MIFLGVSEKKTNFSLWRKFSSARWDSENFRQKGEKMFSFSKTWFLGVSEKNFFFTFLTKILAPLAKYAKCCWLHMQHLLLVIVAKNGRLNRSFYLKKPSWTYFQHEILSIKAFLAAEPPRQGVYCIVLPSSWQARQYTAPVPNAWVYCRTRRRAPGSVQD